MPPAVSHRRLRLWRAKPARPHGFALVVVLLMLVLLVGIGVAMLGLSSVTLRQSERELAHAEARANARMALMLALGDLQRLAGPDTRVTATADIAGTDNGLRLDMGGELGNGLSVSGNSKGLATPMNATRRWTGVWRNADDPERIFNKTPCVEPLGWLVGGRAPSPDDPTLALGPDGRPAHPDKAVKLAGGDGPVSVPWTDLKNGGRCAWWVGDEGVKARVDLTSSLPSGAAADELAIASPRRDWSVIDGMEAYPPAGSPGEHLLDKMISPGDLRLIDPSLADRDLTHVATTWSRGVLSNSLRGGLKDDMTPLAWDKPHGLPDMASRIVPASTAPGLENPRWQLLRDFARMRKEMENGVLMTRHGDDWKPAIAPVMDELRMLFGARVVPAAGGKFRVHPCVKVAVRFSNPYTVPLAWDQPLELEFFNVTHPESVPTRLYGAYSEPSILPRYFNEPALLNRAVFVVPPGMLPPGESVVFANNSPLSRPITQSASRFEVPLAAYDAAAGADFRNCLRFEHPSPNQVSGEWLLHLQEECGTSQMDLAIRLQGEDGELRRIERIEINNFHQSHSAWRIPPGMAGTYGHPVPVQLYVFGTGLENGPAPSGATVLGVDGPVVSALWDGWFFSTLPEDGKGQPENPRFVATNSADPSLPPAAKFLMDGSFNVNSVEPAAWTALLAGLNGIRHPSDTSTVPGTMLPRSPAQLGVADGADGICEPTLAGYRRLTPEHINTLAAEIVRQVRLRGPFVSLSHFVNRALVPMAENPELGRSGALQCAIDQSGINVRTSTDGSCGGLFDEKSGRLQLRAEASGAPAADVPGPDPTRWADSPPDGIWPKSSLDTNPGSLAGILADREVLSDDDLKTEQGHRATGMPGWLTQADVLQVIGPSLTARSDTFRIRACGESSRRIDGKPVRVFCEAVVQRMPEFVDASNRPDARTNELTPVNQRLGRKFQIISFRWLVEGEM